MAATLGVAKGRISPLDLMLVETPKGALYSFLTVGWGIMADIDIESERLRAIGEIRFTLWAFWRVFSEYHLELRFARFSERTIRTRLRFVNVVAMVWCLQRIPYRRAHCVPICGPPITARWHRRSVVSLPAAIVAVARAAEADVADALLAPRRSSARQFAEAPAARSWDATTMATLAFAHAFRQYFYD